MISTGLAEFIGGLQHHLSPMNGGANRPHGLIHDQLHTHRRRQMKHRVALGSSAGIDGRFILDRIADNLHAGPVPRKWFCEVLRIRPVDRSSRMTTEFPRSSNCSARCEPMNPAPPVMRKRCPIFEGYTRNKCRRMNAEKNMKVAGGARVRPGQNKAGSEVHLSAGFARKPNHQPSPLQPDGRSYGRSVSGKG